jgi:SOS response regulatory protein OraA/RecX
MNKRLRNSVSKAFRKLNEADLAVQAIERHLVFSGFRGDEPFVSACSGGEIILEYKGFEMSIEEAIERMEEYGYISRSDFPEY